MGDGVLRCPLCCNEEFDSKNSLAEHLSSVINVTCPVCAEKFSSVERLVEHLSSDNCETVLTVEFDKTSISDNENDVSVEENHISSAGGSKDNDIEGQITAHSIKMSSDTTSEVNKMYVELLSKQLMKPCLQTQELKLVMENGESRYVVLSNDAIQNFSSENTVVTKQNNDGTISLTTVQDPELEAKTESVPSPETYKTEMENNDSEIYSCNTCGVSFSSVIEHIQNYHNDQDVVVEEPIGPTNDTEPIENEHIENSEVETSPTVKLTLRRMITDTGDLVEIPVDHKNNSEAVENMMEEEITLPQIRNDTDVKQGRAKKYVQLEKFCDSLVKNIKEDERGGPYHKVVLKDLVTTNGNKIKIYNCISCNIYVPTIAEFKSRPCKILKYTCTQCPMAYENSKSLCAHMKVHKAKSSSVSEVVTVSPVAFECTICGTVFPTSKSLKLHKRMHDPIKSRPIEPPLETKLGNPVSEDKYLCAICNKLIPVDYKMVHQNSHKNSNKMNCHICNKKFSSKEYLDMHLGVHNLDKIVDGNKQDKSLPYNCMYCNRQFARPHEKVKHERIHTGEKPHSCEICGKSFRVAYCLTLHMRTHTGARPYGCPHCGKRFKAHSVYNHHLLTHSEIRAYKCPFCPKAFKTSVQLAGHKNSHTKPFSCQQCNRPFASLYAVRVHMDSHAKSNTLKFTCSMCGASYARAFALKDHMRQVHKPDMDAANALSGLKEEEWLIQEGDDEEETIQPLQRDLSDEINELEMTTDSLIVN